MEVIDFSRIILHCIIFSFYNTLSRHAMFLDCTKTPQISISLNYLILRTDPPAPVDTTLAPSFHLSATIRLLDFLWQSSHTIPGECNSWQTRVFQDNSLEIRTTSDIYIACNLITAYCTCVLLYLRQNINDEN